MVNYILLVCNRKLLQTQSHVSYNYLPFLTAYFAKLKIKLVDLLKIKQLKLQECTSKLTTDTSKALFLQVFQVETN